MNEICLKDYKAPTYLVDRVEMDVSVHKKHVRVSTRLSIRRNEESVPHGSSLILYGENQELEVIRLNSKKLGPKDYEVHGEGITLTHLPDHAVIEVVSTHDPYHNTALSGLYASGTMLSTQCEPEGFRRITYYPDRPDVMAQFRVTIHADRRLYPHLLSNGNLIRKGREAGGRHFAVWDDPFPKPSYLFALVAGQFDVVRDRFCTRSGRTVLIEIFVEPGKKNLTHFARDAIKRAMAWDEKVFGLEYDLDRFMLVATPFYNMGAMENKGLNIFNDSCLLGSSSTTTDQTISFIERVVGHEYFHNWTGNRVTCRDWFQLSLKEGLTVFREQEFMGDMNSRAVERLANVRFLRRAQFAEDAGAMAHPVRPARYKAIDNFYTATVYEKGSELVRMLQTIVGRKGFFRGLKLYFKRHDGTAVTCDDFVAAVADANGLDARQFMRWYEQSGTPTVHVTSHYDPKKKILSLRVSQKTTPTPDQKRKRPLFIPITYGLLDQKGKEVMASKTFCLTKQSETIMIPRLSSKPVLSILRDFSAPVRLEIRGQTQSDLQILFKHDTDPFNRWEAGYTLMTQALMSRITGHGVVAHDLELFEVFSEMLRDPKLDPSFKAMTLALPTENELGLALRARGQLIDVDRVYRERRHMFTALAQYLKDELIKVTQSYKKISPKATDGLTMGKRSLKNISLAYLASLKEEATLNGIVKIAENSNNMTDTIAALAILIEEDEVRAKKSLKSFEMKWAAIPTVMDKWFALQASSKKTSVVNDVKKLISHSGFSFKNPNRISALIGSFAYNGLGFHVKDGSGYAFIARMIAEIDPINPLSAASLAKAFTRLQDYDLHRQALMKKELKGLAHMKNLSPNTSEVIEKSLKGS